MITLGIIPRNISRLHLHESPSKCECSPIGNRHTHKLQFVCRLLSFPGSHFHIDVKFFLLILFYMFIHVITLVKVTWPNQRLFLSRGRGEGHMSEDEKRIDLPNTSPFIIFIQF